MATLTVVLPPSVRIEPPNLTVRAGSNVTFRAVAMGTGTLRFRWRLNGTDITNATNSILTITNVQRSHAGNYSVLVTDDVGAVESQPATLTVPPIITRQPTNTTALVGGDATFCVEAEGTIPMSFRWRRAGITMTSFNGYITSTPTNSVLTLTNVQFPNGTNYTVVVTNIVGSSRVSSNATLMVVAPPVIVRQPLSEEVSCGGSVTLAVSATGSVPLHYQWLRDGVAIEGATNSNLEVNNIGPEDIGGYSVTVSNLGGTISSTEALVTAVETEPFLSITRQGTNVTICWTQTCVRYLLLEAARLSPLTSWLPVAPGADVGAGQSSVTVSVTNDTRIFRLVAQPRQFIKVLPGSVAQIRSNGVIEAKPISGYLGWALLPQTAPSEGSRLKLNRLLQGAPRYWSRSGGPGPGVEVAPKRLPVFFLGQHLGNFNPARD